MQEAEFAQSIPIVVVAGPTAAGKTKLGVSICKELGGEVVSADSMQIYRHLSVGTAKPSLQEQEGIPHHLMDFLPPSETFSVAEYAKAADACIAEIHARGKLPVIVGGTGLYIRAVVDHICFAEEERNPVFRRELLDFAKEAGAQALWERLRGIDPEAAAALHPNNLGRVARAIEIFEATGVTMTAHQKASKQIPSPYQALMIGLSYRDRQKLYDKINSRVTAMLSNGLIEEAQWLLENGYSSTSFQAIGYKEMLSYLQGAETLETAAERIRQGSRHYAKRQLTWFGREENIRWFFHDDYESFDFLEEAVLNYIQKAGA